MKRFNIDIIPAIPLTANIWKNVPDLNFERNEIISEVSQKYQVIYNSDDDKYAYHPADIITILNDISGELDAFERSESHYISLSGYNVAYAICKGGFVWFSDVPRQYGDEGYIELNGKGIPIEEVRAEFRQTCSNLLDYIFKKVNLSLADRRS